MEGNSKPGWVVGFVGTGMASRLGGRGRKPGTKITGCSYINGRHLKTSLKSKVNLNLNYFIYRNKKRSRFRM